MKQALICLPILLGSLSAFGAEAGREWTRIDPHWNADYTDLEYAFGALFATGTEGAIFRAASAAHRWEVIPTGSTETLTQIRLVGTECFVLGTEGGLLASSDGTTWTPRTTGVNVELRDIIRGDPGYLAVGAEGMVLTSPDGHSWTSQTTPTTNHLHSAVWTGTNYVVAGTRGTLLTSDNGTEWIEAIPNTLPDIFTLRWDGSLLRAYNDAGYLYESSDGFQWTQSGRASTLDLGSNHSIAEGPPGTVIGLERGYIAFSPDDATWTETYIGLSNVRGVRWDGAQFVALGSAGRLASSPDGLRWTSAGTGRFPFLATAAAWDGLTMIFCGSKGEIFSSTDLESWTSEVSGTDEYLRSALWTGSLFVVTGNNGLILTSPDGRAWTRRVPEARWDFLASHWSGSEILVGGEDGVLLGSPDGVTWTVHHPGELSEICWDGTKFVAVSERVCLHSADGITWTIEGSVPLPIVTSGNDYANVHDLIWSGALYLLVGHRGSAYTSPDGRIWTPRDTGTRAHLSQAIWNGTRFVVRGSDDVIIHSVDAETWTEVTPELPTGVSDLAWNGSQFLAPFRDGTVSSPDGITWTTVNNFRVEDAGVLAWGAGTFVALGPDGFNATSPDGSNWTVRPDLGFHDFSDVFWTGTRFLATAGFEVLSSPDGITWSETTFDGAGELNSSVSHFVRTGTTTIALLRNYDVLSITNGSDWQLEIHRELTEIIGEITQGAGKLLASVGNEIATSTDGISWNLHPTAYAGHHQITWTGTSFFALSGTNLIHSPDGVTWALINETGLGGGPRALEWNGTQLVAYSPSNGDPKTGGMFLSGNGSSWDQVHAISADPLGFDILRAGDRLVTVGSILLSSENLGLTWSGDATFSDLPVFRDVCASPDLYVAVGTWGNIATSPDLAEWTLRSVDRSIHFESVVWTGQRFLAFGSQRVLISDDGATWREVNVAPGFQVTDAVQAQSETFAVGLSTFRRSPDGIRWRSSETGIAGLDAVATSGNRIVVGGLQGALGHSSDGVFWSRIPGHEFNDIAWNGSRYVAVGEENSVFTSLDGTRWVYVKEGRSPDPDLNAVVWTGERFVAVGDRARAETSDDGLTWTTRSTHSSDYFQDVLWTGSLLVAVGSNGRIITSADGRTWSPQPPPVDETLYAIAHDGNRFVAVGALGIILTSTDGSSWQVQPSGTPHLLFDVTWTGTRFVACGNAGTVLGSPDGLSWTTENTTIPDTPLKSIGSHGGALWIGGSWGGIFRSDVPGTWTEVRPELLGGLRIANRVRGFSFDGPSLLAVGSDGLVLSSESGTDWTLQQQGFDLSDSVTDLCWTGTEFVAVTSRSRIFTSPDGVSWSLVANTPSGQLVSCATSGNEFLALGDRDNVRSEDGVVWEELPPISYPGIESVAWTGTEFLAVGSEGRIFQSRARGAGFGHYLAWAQSHGLAGIERDPLGDPDGDGCNNLFELAFGTDPTSADRKDSELMAGVIDGAVQASLRHPQDVEGVRYSFEISRDLQFWEWSANLNTEDRIEDLGDGTERLHVTLTDFDPQAEHELYVRIRIDVESDPLLP